jgi:prolipoprotein diacylglyceryltransferase
MRLFLVIIAAIVFFVIKFLSKKNRKKKKGFTFYQFLLGLFFLYLTVAAFTVEENPLYYGILAFVILGILIKDIYEQVQSNKSAASK